MTKARPSAASEIFEFAQRELDQGTTIQELELNISQLQTISQQQHEHAAILFDLALEELIDPTAASKYRSLEQITLKSSTESPALSKALRRFEAVVSSSVQPAIKPSSTNTHSTSYRKPIHRVISKAVPVPFWNRVRATILDAPAIGLISLLLLTIFLPLSSHSLFASIEKLFIGNALERTPIVALYLKLIIPAAIIQALLALPKRGTTLGMRALGLKITCSDGSLPTSSQLTARALLAPLSLAVAPLTIFFRKNISAADLLTSTTVTRR